MQAVLRRAYVLYGTEAYLPVMKQCALSIRDHSDVCILIYTIDTTKSIGVDNTIEIPWSMNLGSDNLYDQKVDGNFYIKREKVDIYNILTERITIIEHALTNYADTVVYIDSDSIATENIDRIFDMYHDEPYAMATEGIYDWMFYDGRGACETRDDMTGTLEYNACQLFGVDQSVRQRYRTTNLFIAGQNAIPFLDEWMSMAKHPEVLKNREFYAPFHEETLYNVLLWKYNYIDGLPYLYMNGNSEEIERVWIKNAFINDTYFLREWVRVPEKKKNLLVFHGEKRIDEMKKMRNLLTMKDKKTTVLYLAPHLSTGGMPAFLLKRVQALVDTNVNIIVVEYANWSDEYVVHKKELYKWVDCFYTLGENKMQLLDIIHEHKVNVVHIDEMVEDSVTNFDRNMLNALYDNDRTWNIIETCHNIIFNPDKEKVYHPDAYIFCTPYHLKTFDRMPSRKFVIEYPIQKILDSKFDKKLAKALLKMKTDKVHVLNVGLWTPGKNQAEGIEIARHFPDVQFHFVGNQAVNFQHYWEPLMKDLPKNVTVWGERDDVDKFMLACDIFMFNSTWECSPLVLREAASFGMPIMSRNLPQYIGMFDGYILPFDGDDKLEKMKQMLDGWKPTKVPQSTATFDFMASHLYAYNEVKKDPITIQKAKFDINFVGQPFLEITGPSNSNYRVQFLDENGISIYENTIRSNHWVRLNRRWFTDWKINIWENKEFLFQYELDYTNERVFITFESSSLGDTIAWMSYVEEFRKKHNCHVILSTFKNFLFKNAYPEIEFVEPGTEVHGLRGMYSIGWFYDSNKEPVLPNTIPLQKAATNILGLEYREIKPLLDFKPDERPIRGKYVTIATNSTAGCKFWTKEGWQEVINYLVDKGYDVINVSLEDNPFDNCKPLKDKSMKNTMDYIYHSEFFIGLSSGLSWLAWALDKQVVMISNFTESDHEFECIRVTKNNVCNGCWNSHKYKFDKSWDWCPRHAGTNRQFECQTSISGTDVINLLNQKLLT